MFFNELNRYIFVNGVEICKFKAIDSEINENLLRLGNASKDFLLVNVKKSGLFGYVNDFLVDNGSIGIDYILDIHEYLMEKHDIR